MKRSTMQGNGTPQSDTQGNSTQQDGTAQSETQDSAWAIPTVVIATVFFGLAIAMRHRFDPWRTNFVAGLVGIPLALFVLRQQVRELLAVDRKSAMRAAALGVSMVALTHLGYQLVSWLVPDLRAIIESLYQDIEQTSPPMVLKVPLILFIVAAEELIWRGVAFQLLPDRISRMRSILFATLLYAVPQFIGGSWLLVCAAFAVGAVFSWQRSHYGRLTEALISHGIWSVAVFGLVPLF